LLKTQDFAPFDLDANWTPTAGNSGCGLHLDSTPDWQYPCAYARAVVNPFLLASGDENKLFPYIEDAHRFLCPSWSERGDPEHLNIFCARETNAAAACPLIYTAVNPPPGGGPASLCSTLYCRFASEQGTAIVGEATNLALANRQRIALK
jgi:hypothetical protein